MANYDLQKFLTGLAIELHGAETPVGLRSSRAAYYSACAAFEGFPLDLVQYAPSTLQWSLEYPVGLRQPAVDSAIIPVEVELREVVLATLTGGAPIPGARCMAEVLKVLASSDRALLDMHGVRIVSDDGMVWYDSARVFTAISSGRRGAATIHQLQARFARTYLSNRFLTALYATKVRAFTDKMLAVLAAKNVELYSEADYEMAKQFIAADLKLIANHSVTDPVRESSMDEPVVIREF